MKLLLIVAKPFEKQKSNFSRNALFHMKTRVSLKYFGNDCRWLQLTIKLAIYTKHWEYGKWEILFFTVLPKFGKDWCTFSVQVYKSYLHCSFCFSHLIDNINISSNCRAQIHKSYMHGHFCFCHLKISQSVIIVAYNFVNFTCTVIFAFAVWFCFW